MNGYPDTIGVHETDCRLPHIDSRYDREWEDEDFRDAEKNIASWRESDSESAVVEARLMARKYVENGDYEAAWEAVQLIDAIFAGNADLREALGREMSTEDLIAALRWSLRRDVGQAFGVKIPPNCTACDGLGHQNGCEVCHNSGIDLRVLRA